MNRATAARSSSVLAAVLRPLVAIALTLGAVAGGVGSAEAAVIGPRAWRVQPSGRVVDPLPVIVNGGGSFDAYPLDASTASLAIDGTEVPRGSFVATTPFGRNLYLYHAPAPALADGIHAFRVHVADTRGVVSAYEWSAVVAVPPTAAWSSPGAGETSYDGRPAIGMTLSDNTPGTALAVAGVIRLGSASGPVVATFGGEGLEAGPAVFAASGTLVPGSYRLCATVTDGDGNARVLDGAAARAFQVVGLEPMSLPPAECTASGCHTSAGHPTSGRTCAGCHVKVYHEYADCQDCHYGHDAPVTVTGVFGPCTSCHAPGRADVPGHDASSVEASHQGGCGGCHEGSLVDVHALTPDGEAYAYQCDLCHGGGDARVSAAVSAGNTSCSACHDLGVAHPDLEATHAGTMTNGPVTVFTDHDGVGEVVWDVQCSLCHASAQLLDVHGSDCAACHGGARPAASFAAWNGSCQQGACHSGLQHDGGDAAHTPYYDANCDICHEPSFVVYYSTCQWCHDPSDDPAPVTTSDVRSAYVGTATIRFESAGIGWTSHLIDGADRQGGDVRVVQGPATGSAQHALEYWTVSGAGVEEVPHKTAMFTIAADVTPPVTASNAKAAYGGRATIVLTPSDDNSTPVQRTYWRLDGGAATSGRTVVIAEPAAGTEGHTLEFWSIDPSGNAEEPKSVAFTVTKDVVPPVTTSNAPAYDRSTSATNVTLTATDPAPGSGVAATYYRRNGAAQTTGATVVLSGQGTHTIEYWSVDRSGNVEPHNLQTVVKDWTAPVTGSDNVGTYVGSATIRLSPGDTLAGVAATYYLLDGDPQASGTGIVVTTDGVHTLKYWSVDRAGNVEQVRTETFTLTGGVPDTSPPVTTSDARTAYTGGATITLSASDAGGSGVAATYYRLDGADPVAGTVVSVPMPPAGTAAHTLVYWSEDALGNAESPTTVEFTCTYVSAVVLRLVWGDADTSGYTPVAGSFAEWTVRAGGPSGPVVATGSSSAPGWDGIDDVVVPYTSQPYHVVIDWWDEDWGDGDYTVHYPVSVTGPSPIILRY